MSSLQFTLKIKDLSAPKLKSSTYKYYLKAKYSHENVETIPSKNLIRGDLSYTFEDAQSLESVEIWNQTKGKLLGTFKLKNLDSTQVFEHTFKNSNIIFRAQRAEETINPEDYFNNMSLTESFTISSSSASSTTSEDSLEQKEWDSIFY